MNYFAHGVRFVDRPYFLAGTALPDWLSVVDRRVRLRARRVTPFADGTTTPESELAAGVLQHLADDAWFHATAAFAVVSADLTRRFRETLPPEDAHRPSLLGHIVTELILDGVLIAQDPRRLDNYYDAFRAIDPGLIERAVNRMAREPTDRLAPFIPLFSSERFLADYSEPARLRFRLNQVLRRVKLSPLPAEAESVLRAARTIVEHNAAALLQGRFRLSASLILHRLKDPVMKYGLNLLLWTTDVNESHHPLLEQIKGWGYDGVELPIFELEIARYKALGERLNSLGLERTAVTVSTPEANPISDSAAVRAAAVNRLKQVVNACQAVGADKLCGPIHSALGQFSGKGPTADEWKWGKDTLSQVEDYARQAGVTLVVEYLNRFECYFLNCAADTARFIKEINHPSVRMMYDTFHANIEEKSIAAAIKVCAPVTVHVHISENDRSTPGEGHVDWDTTFKTLKDIDYDGWLTVEAFGLALPALAAATKIWRRMYPSEEYLATRALKFMKSRWEG